MRGEELTLVRDAQAEIARRLDLEQLIKDLEHSLEVEKAWLLTLVRQALEELEPQDFIELCKITAKLVEKLDDFDS